jgi:hypothetical protein
MSARISAREWASQNGVHEDTAQKMCRDGKLVARRIGRNWQIDPVASERLLSRSFGNVAERELLRK